MTATARKIVNGLSRERLLEFANDHPDDATRGALIDLAGKWKHNWIPLDEIAAAIKAKRMKGDGIRRPGAPSGVVSRPAGKSRLDPKGAAKHAGIVSGTRGKGKPQARPGAAPAGAHTPQRGQRAAAELASEHASRQYDRRIGGRESTAAAADLEGVAAAHRNASAEHHKAGNQAEASWHTGEANRLDRHAADRRQAAAAAAAHYAGPAGDANREAAIAGSDASTAARDARHAQIRKEIKVKKEIRNGRVHFVASHSNGTNTVSMAHPQTPGVTDAQHRKEIRDSLHRRIVSDQAGRRPAAGPDAGQSGGDPNVASRPAGALSPDRVAAANATGHSVKSTHPVGSPVMASQPGIGGETRGHVTGHTDNGMVKVQHTDRHGNQVIGTFNPHHTRVLTGQQAAEHDFQHSGPTAAPGLKPSGLGLNGKPIGDLPPGYRITKDPRMGPALEHNGKIIRTSSAGNEASLAAYARDHAAGDTSGHSRTAQDEINARKAGHAIGDRVESEYGPGVVTHVSDRSVSYKLDKSGEVLNVQRGTPGYDRIKKASAATAPSGEAALKARARGATPAERAAMPGPHGEHRGDVVTLTNDGTSGPRRAVYEGRDVNGNPLYRGPVNGQMATSAIGENSYHKIEPAGKAGAAAEPAAPAAPAKKVRKPSALHQEYRDRRAEQDRRFEAHVGGGIAAQDTNTQEYRDYFGVGDHSTSPQEQRLTFKSFLEERRQGKEYERRQQQAYDAGMKLGAAHGDFEGDTTAHDAEYAHHAAGHDEEMFGTGYADGIRAGAGRLEKRKQDGARNLAELEYGRARDAAHGVSQAAVTEAGHRAAVHAHVAAAKASLAAGRRPEAQHHIAKAQEHKGHADRLNAAEPAKVNDRLRQESIARGEPQTEAEHAARAHDWNIANRVQATADGRAGGQQATPADAAVVLRSRWTTPAQKDAARKIGQQRHEGLVAETRQRMAGMSDAELAKMLRDNPLSTSTMPADRKRAIGAVVRERMAARDAAPASDARRFGEAANAGERANIGQAQAQARKAAQGPPKQGEMFGGHGEHQADLFDPPPAEAPAAGGDASRHAGITVEHSGDGTLVHGTERSDTETTAALKAQGFKWSRNLNAWYLPRTWGESTRETRVRGLEARLGDKITVQRGPVAKSTSGADERAARIARNAELEQKHTAAAGKLDAEAQRRFDASHRATEGIPFGQPILLGHHSQRRHENAIAKSHANMGAGVQAARDAEEARSRAASAAARNRLEEDPKFLARRLDRNQAEHRKVLRSLAGANPQDEHTQRLEAYRQELEGKIGADQAAMTAAGGAEHSKATITPGDVITYRGSAHVVHRTNAKTVTVPHWDERMAAAGYTDTIPYSQIQTHGRLEAAKPETLRKMLDRPGLPEAVKSRIRAILRDKGESTA